MTTTPQGQQPTHQPPKRCANCGAPVTQQPAEGEGLPCGH